MAWLVSFVPPVRFGLCSPSDSVSPREIPGVRSPGLSRGTLRRSATVLSKIAAEVVGIRRKSSQDCCGEPTVLDSRPRGVLTGLEEKGQELVVGVVDGRAPPAGGELNPGGQASTE